MSEFPGVALMFGALLTKGNKVLAGDATMGNARLVNVLKTTD